MMKPLISLLLIVFMFFKSSQSYLSGRMQLNPCENISNTAAVENFFNIVFTEFHNIPPVCICVQMCVEQPTYCYPNGCLKRQEKKCVETKSVLDNINIIQNVRKPKSVMFLVENQNDFMDNVNNFVEKTENPLPMELIYRPNPFKELVLKYKKNPKLEMRYNLREQVKNMKNDKLKRDRIDVSKTRWPSNRHLLHGKQVINRIQDYRKSKDKKQSKFFVSMFPELESVTNSPKLYKKYLTKRENNNGVNVETLFLYKTDAANFTLETLIDSLIENSLDISKNQNYSKLNMFDEFTNRSEINRDNYLLQTKGNNSEIVNTVNIVSINSTNENIDSNKYLPNTNKTNEKGYLKVIAIMSEKIDKQNKLSVDLMERVTGNRKIDTYTIATTVPISLETSMPNTNNNKKTLNYRDYDIASNITTIKPTAADITTTVKSREVSIPVIRKHVIKGKQRIVRKLQNKNNVY